MSEAFDVIARINDPETGRRAKALEASHRASHRADPRYGPEAGRQLLDELQQAAGDRPIQEYLRTDWSSNAVYTQQGEDAMLWSGFQDYGGDIGNVNTRFVGQVVVSDAQQYPDQPISTLGDTGPGQVLDMLRNNDTVAQGLGFSSRDPGDKSHPHTAFMDELTRKASREFSGKLRGHAYAARGYFLPHSTSILHGDEMPGLLKNPNCTGISFARAPMAISIATSEGSTTMMIPKQLRRLLQNPRVFGPLQGDDPSKPAYLPVAKVSRAWTPLGKKRAARKALALALVTFAAHHGRPVDIDAILLLPSLGDRWQVHKTASRMSAVYAAAHTQPGPSIADLPPEVVRYARSMAIVTASTVVVISTAAGALYLMTFGLPGSPSAAPSHASVTKSAAAPATGGAMPTTSPIVIITLASTHASVTPAPSESALPKTGVPARTHTLWAMAIIALGVILVLVARQLQLRRER